MVAATPHSLFFGSSSGFAKEMLGVRSRVKQRSPGMSGSDCRTTAEMSVRLKQHTTPDGPGTLWLLDGDVHAVNPPKLDPYERAEPGCRKDAWTAMSSELLGQQALPRVGHRWVKRATIAAVILLALCLFLVGLDCLVAGPTGGCAVIVGQAAIVTSAFLVSVVVQMLGNSRVRQVSGRH